MALSGSNYTNVGSHWRLRYTWSATQNIAANSSSVTVNLYWEARTSYGSMSTSSKNGQITINGSSYAFSSTASLSNGQSRLISSETRTVSHDSDGTKTFGISASFNLAGTTLSGTTYNNITISNTNWTLNTIPRKSTLSSSASWTAGNSLAVSISRASSSFTHDLAISVGGSLFKTVTGIGASTTVTFSAAEIKTLYTRLNGNATVATSFVLTTKSGSTSLGTNTYAGTLTAPSASTITTSFGSVRYMNESISISISRSSASFTHTVRYYFQNTLIKTFTGLTTSGVVSFNSTEINNMLDLIPSSQSGAGYLEVDTLYDGVKVRSTTTKTLWLTAINVEPTFSNTQISYRDTNTTTNNLTGTTNNVIVQNKSLVTVSIKTAATPGRGTTISKYVAILGSTSAERPGSTGDIAIGTVNAATNQTLTVKAIDARGFETSVFTTVVMIPYSDPTMVATATRLNKFEASTTLKLRGVFSGIVSAGTRRNSISYTRFRTREYPVGTFGSYTTPSNSQDTGNLNTLNYTMLDRTITLDNTKQYEVEFEVKDQLTTKTVKIVVAKGQPIMFIDSEKQSVGIGKFPEYSNSLETQGNVSVGSGLIVEGTSLLKGIASFNSELKYTGTFSAANRVFDFGQGYVVYSDNAGSGSSNNRIWWDAPANSEFVFGPRSGASVAEKISLRARNVDIYGELVNEGYTTLSLLNGWQHYSSVSGQYGQARFWKDKNGIVHVTGLIMSGTTTAGTAIAMLPAGYRPGKRYVFATMSATTGNATRIDVSATDGAITIQAGGTQAFLSLENIRFKAEG